jgi:DNA-binding CsgD family transcriptional regulator/tetratricopeptide (TPR) repeat protein
LASTESDTDEFGIGAVDDYIDVVQLSLGPLTDDQVLELGADVVGRELSENEAGHLLLASGNPLLASQLAEEIVAGRIQSDGAGMPTSFTDSLLSRTRQLEENSVELLHLAAVWGQPLTLGDATEMSGLRSTHQVLNHVRQAAALGLIDIRQGKIEFRHELIRRFYYEALSHSAKVELHRHCAAFILGGTTSAVRAAQHAKLCAQLGDDGGLDILLDAAQECSATRPHVAADFARAAFALLGPDDPRWYETGRACAETLVCAQHGADALRILDLLLTRTAEPDSQARLQVYAARALLPMGRLDDITERMDSTLSLPGISTDLGARLMAAKALALCRTESASAASAVAQKALEMNSDDPVVATVAAQALGQAANNTGRHEYAYSQFHLLRTRFGPPHLASEIMALQNLDRYADAQALLDQALSDAGGQSDTVWPDLLTAQQRQEWNLGRFDAAVTTAQHVIRVSDELGNQANKIEAWIMLAIHAMLHQQFDRARELLHLAERDVITDDSVRTPDLLVLRGHIEAAQGNAAGAVSIVEPVIRDAAKRRHYRPRSQEWPHLLAGIALAGGDRSFARLCADEANRFASQNPHIATLRGIALQTRGLVEHNWKLLENAASVLSRCPRVMLHARARADLGIALLEDGQTDRGTSELVCALSALEWLDLPMYINEVRTALDTVERPWECPVPRPSPAARQAVGWDTLTQAELAVAKWVVKGATNQMAAAELHLSVHTVKTHLQSIFQKLDVRSRVQLANAWNSWQNRQFEPRAGAAAQ